LSFYVHATISNFHPTFSIILVEMIINWYFMHGDNQMPIYFCAWHVLKAWHLCSMEKIKDNGCDVQYWTTFTLSCTCPLNQVKTLKPSWLVGEIRSLKVSPNICPMIHGFDTFWTYYFQVGTWINFQSIIVVPPCCAYPKIFIFWIKVETPMMDLTIPCGAKW
jgi:hypothetical protein